MLQTRQNKPEEEIKKLTTWAATALFLQANSFNFRVWNINWLLLQQKGVPLLLHINTITRMATKQTSQFSKSHQSTTTASLMYQNSKLYSAIFLIIINLVCNYVPTFSKAGSCNNRIITSVLNSAVGNTGFAISTLFGLST